MLALRESAELAATLIAAACEKQLIVPGQLTVHADRGSSMRSKPVAFFARRPQHHQDPQPALHLQRQPYSESQFRTLKYRPEFPGRFGGLEDGRVFCQGFIPWYNDQHRHSGIGMMTPAIVHYGQAPLIRQQRQAVLDAAYQAHPDRFVRRPPTPLPLPKEVWIIKPPNSE